MDENVPVTGVFQDVTGKPFNNDRTAVRRLNKMLDEGDCLLVALPIARLNATQAEVNGDFREAARKRLGDGYDLPAVVKYKGRYYVTDGHHRLMGAAAEGKSSAPVRLFDLDGDTQLDFPLLDYNGHSSDTVPGLSGDAPKPGM